MSFIIVLFFLTFFGSLLTSLSGLGGGSLILVGYLVIYPPEIAVPLHSFTQLAANGIRVGLFFNKVRWKFVLAYASLMIPFSWLAGEVFWFINSDILKIMVGLFILYSILPLKKQSDAEISLKTFTILGALSGFLGVFVGAVGPMVTPFFNRIKATRDENISTKSAGQLTLQISKIVAFSGAAGISFWELKDKIWVIILGTVLGILVAFPISKKMSDQQFNKIVNLLLFLVSLKIIYDGVVGLLKS